MRLCYSGNGYFLWLISALISFALSHCYVHSSLIFPTPWNGNAEWLSGSSVSIICSLKRELLFPWGGQRWASVFKRLCWPFFYLETEMEQWNWSRDKVSFPKNLGSMCSDTYMSWAFLHWCKLLFHPLFLSFPIGGDAVQLVCLLRALTVEKIFLAIFKSIVVWMLAL